MNSLRLFLSKTIWCYWTHAALRPINEMVFYDPKLIWINKENDILKYAVNLKKKRQYINEN